MICEVSHIATFIITQQRYLEKSIISRQPSAIGSQLKEGYDTPNTLAPDNREDFSKKIHTARIQHDSNRIDGLRSKRDFKVDVL